MAAETARRRSVDALVAMTLAATGDTTVAESTAEGQTPAGKGRRGQRGAGAGEATRPARPRAGAKTDRAPAGEGRGPEQDQGVWEQGGRETGRELPVVGPPRQVPVAHIEVQEGFNVRRLAGDDDPRVERLRPTIAQHGLLEPIVVNRHGDRYVLVCGETRFRAVRGLEVETIAAVVIERPLSRKEMLVLMMTENISREQLSVVEEARGFQRLVDEGLSRHEAGALVGKSRQYVQAVLRVLRSPRLVRYVERGVLSGRVARELARLVDDDDQDTVKGAIDWMVAWMEAKRPSMQAVESAVTEILTSGHLPAAPVQPTPSLRRSPAERLRDRMDRDLKSLRRMTREEAAAYLQHLRSGVARLEHELSELYGVGSHDGSAGTDFAR